MTTEPPTSNKSPFRNDLLDVLPVRGLFFPPPHNRRIQNIVHLKNRGEKLMLFKLKCRKPDLYRVKPKVGYLLPNGPNVEVVITLLPSEEIEGGGPEISLKDGFSIVYYELPAENNLVEEKKKSSKSSSILEPANVMWGKVLLAKSKQDSKEYRGDICVGPYLPCLFNVDAEKVPAVARVLVEKIQRGGAGRQRQESVTSQADSMEHHLDAASNKIEEMERKLHDFEMKKLREREREQKPKGEVDRKAKEEADHKAKEEADRQARAEAADRKSKEEKESVKDAPKETLKKDVVSSSGNDHRVAVIKNETTEVSTKNQPPPPSIIVEGSENQYNRSSGSHLPPKRGESLQDQDKPLQQPYSSSRTTTISKKYDGKEDAVVVHNNNNNGRGGIEAILSSLQQQREETRRLLQEEEQQAEITELRAQAVKTYLATLLSPALEEGESITLLEGRRSDADVDMKQKGRKKNSSPLYPPSPSSQEQIDKEEILDDNHHHNREHSPRPSSSSKKKGEIFSSHRAKNETSGNNSSITSPPRITTADVAKAKWLLEDTDSSVWSDSIVVGGGAMGGEETENRIYSEYKDENTTGLKKAEKKRQQQKHDDHEGGVQQQSKKKEGGAGDWNENINVSGEGASSTTSATVRIGEGGSPFQHDNEEVEETSSSSEWSSSASSEENQPQKNQPTREDPPPPLQCVGTAKFEEQEEKKQKEMKKRRGRKFTPSTGTSQVNGPTGTLESTQQFLDGVVQPMVGEKIHNNLNGISEELLNDDDKEEKNRKKKEEEEDDFSRKSQEKQKEISAAAAIQNKEDAMKNIRHLLWGGEDVTATAFVESHQEVFTSPFQSAAHPNMDKNRGGGDDESSDVVPFLLSDAGENFFIISANKKKKKEHNAQELLASSHISTIWKFNYFQFCRDYHEKTMSIWLDEVSRWSAYGCAFYLEVAEKQKFAFETANLERAEAGQRRFLKEEYQDELTKIFQEHLDDLKVLYWRIKKNNQQRELEMSYPVTMTTTLSSSEPIAVLAMGRRPNRAPPPPPTSTQLVDPNAAICRNPNLTTNLSKPNIHQGDQSPTAALTMLSNPKHHMHKIFAAGVVDANGEQKNYSPSHHDENDPAVGSENSNSLRYSTEGEKRTAAATLSSVAIPSSSESPPYAIQQGVRILHLLEGATKEKDPQFGGDLQQTKNHNGGGVFFRKEGDDEVGAEQPKKQVDDYWSTGRGRGGRENRAEDAHHYYDDGGGNIATKWPQKSNHSGAVGHGGEEGNKFAAATTITTNVSTTSEAAATSASTSFSTSSGAASSLKPPASVVLGNESEGGRRYTLELIQRSVAQTRQEMLQRERESAFRRRQLEEEWRRKRFPS